MVKSREQELDDLLLSIRDHQDKEAFSRLFDAMAARLKAYLCGKGASAESAEDIVQNVMIKVWRRASTFDPAKASAATWIYTIARNARIDMIRRTIKPELDPEDTSLHPTSEPAADDIVEKRQRAEHLRQVLDTLPAEQRLVLDLAYFKDMSHAQIASTTGIPFGTVKSRLRLALRKLKTTIIE